MRDSRSTLRLNGVAIPPVSLDRYGLPDLIFNRKNGTQWAFIEVKIFPDSLRFNQILWFSVREFPVGLLWLVPQSQKQTLTEIQLNGLIEQAAEKGVIVPVRAPDPSSR